MKLTSSAKKRIFSRISYHAVYDDSILDALAYAHDNGFAGIQLATDSPHLSFESLSESSIQKINSLLSSKNMYITIHAADEAISLYTHSHYLRNGMKDYCRAMFEFAMRIKAPLVTIHMGSPAEFRTDMNPEAVMPKADILHYRNVVNENLVKMMEMVDNRFILCVENFQLNEISIGIIKRYLKSNELSLCWDIAKSHNNPGEEKFILSNKSNIKQVHLHDVRHNPDGSVRSHCVIGSGELDFRNNLSKIVDADMIDYCIEVRPREKAKESLETLKSIL